MNLDSLNSAIQESGLQLVDQPWESGLFGKNCFLMRIEGNRPSEARDSGIFHEALESIDGFLRKAGPSMIVTKVPCHWTDERMGLERSGFHLMETQLIFSFEGGGFPAELPEGIRSFAPRDEDALLEIAGTAFSLSRFHMDPELSNELADNSRQEWVRNGIQGRADFVLVHDDSGMADGFVLGKIKDGTVRLDLIGVSPKNQGRGIGSALIIGFLCRCKSTGTAEVATQAHNIASIRAYEKAGFRLKESVYTYHRHNG